MGRNKEEPRTSYQELLTNSGSSANSGHHPIESEAERKRAAKIIDAAVHPDTGKPLFRGHRAAWDLAGDWVNRHRRSADELPALIAYASASAQTSPKGLIATLIKGGDWTPEQTEQHNAQTAYQRLDEDANEIAFAAGGTT